MFSILSVAVPKVLQYNIYYFAWCGDTLTSDDEEKRKKHPAHDCVNVGDIGLHRVAGARGGYGPRGPAALQLRGVSEPGLPNTIEIRTNLQCAARNKEEAQAKGQTRGSCGGCPTQRLH